SHSRMTRLHLTLLLVLAGCGPALESHAATVAAATCSNTDIQAKIDAPSTLDGDTITIPTGTCTWSGNVTVPVTKGLTLQGDGLCTGSPCTWSGGPVIRGSILIYAGANKSYRVTGLQMDLASSSTSQIKVWRTDTAEGSHLVR